LSFGWLSPRLRETERLSIIENPELFTKNANTFFSSAISRIYLDIAEKFFQEESIIIFRIFYPLGELISLHRLCCSPFAVFIYSFMGHFLAATAIQLVNNSSLETGESFSKT
jgi:hypothetical protein